MIGSTSLGSFVVNLGEIANIPCGQGRVFRIGEQYIAVFHTRDFSLYATEPTCPHKGGPLIDGLVGAQKIVCPLHNFVFDLSNGLPIENRCRALKTYPVSVNEEGEIVVGIEELLSSR
jgi:nitrite reductase (NADH) small subunit